MQTLYEMLNNESHNGGSEVLRSRRFLSTRFHLSVQPVRCFLFFSAFLLNYVSADWWLLPAATDEKII